MAKHEGAYPGKSFLVGTTIDTEVGEHILSLKAVKQYSSNCEDVGTDVPSQSCHTA